MKKVAQCRKKIKAGPFNLAQFCMLRFALCTNLDAFPLAGPVV